MEFVLDADPDLPKILYGDAERIRQILISILNSAVRFTMHGSIQMSMQIKNIDLDNISIRYSVKDTGLGFRQKDLEKLFTPFAHAGAAGTQYNEGNGLELSIAKRLVELMGGEMDVKSEYGKGNRDQLHTGAEDHGFPPGRAPGIYGFALCFCSGQK